MSSIVTNFGPYREATRQAIARVGGEPVLVNEDFAAASKSSRNSCLDAVESCDYFLLILGARGGWATPAGKLVVEEEYEHALAKQLTVLAFIQNTSQDEAAARLTAKVSDYVTGRLRVSFDSPADLGEKIAQALEPLLKGDVEVNTANHEIWNRLTIQPRSSHDTSLRLVMLPERRDEVVDPIELGDAAFVRRIYRLGYGEGVRLFDHAIRTASRAGPNELSITHGDGAAQGSGEPRVAVALRSDGGLIVDAVVPRADSSPRNLGLSSWTITHADLRSVLQSMLHFAHALFADLDPHRRFDRLLYNVALINLSYRNIAEDRPSPHQPQSINIKHGQQPVVALDAPRLVNRASLEPERIESEISRIVQLLVLRLT